MPCYSPLKAYQCQDGSVVFRAKAGMTISRDLTLPCSQCVGCRLERSRQWAIRAMHEASLYKSNCFITLTYRDADLPEDRSLHYDHFQKFMKRLRFSYKGCQPVADGTRPIRFYMAGEYGEKLGRPHFHACLFNFDFDDRVPLKKSDSGSIIYTSAKLSELWPYGFVSIGDVNFKSAAYVARYIMKKITGNNSSEHYHWMDASTGEIHERTPEFNKMSLKPGIGAGWLAKFHTDVYPHDHVVVNGKQVKPPKYYDKLITRAVLEAEKSSFEAAPHVVAAFDAMFEERLIKAEKSIDDNTPERLEVKKQVTLAKISKLKRTLT